MPAYPSPHPSIEIPQTDIFNIIFDRPDKQFPDDHPLFVDADTKRTLTWIQLKEQSIAFAHGLKSEFAFKKGEVLAIFSPNQIDTPPVTWGTHWVGGVVTPANPTYTVDELTFQLKDSGARILVTIADLLPIATKAATNAGIPSERIIILGDKRVAGYKHWRQIINHTTTIKYRKVKIQPKKDLAFIVYSSGTTGVPKGVMLSHNNVVTNLMQIIAVEKGVATWDRDRFIAFLPFFHIYGLTCLMHQAARLGTTLVVMSRFDLEKYLQVIQEHKITYAFVVPPVLLLMAKHPLVSKYDLSSLRIVNCGAAPLTKELLNEFYARLKVPVKQGYGLSETSPVTHLGELHDWDQHKGSCGSLLPNMEIKYVSEDGRELERGETGEIWVRGENVMVGYLNNEKATRNCMTEDGFFKTGDIGHEERGVLYITDRLKELIKYKGFQVPPAELEGLLLSHELIDDVAVIGVHSAAQATELPRAYVVLKPNTPRTEETAQQILKFVEAKVAQHKRLRGGVRFVDSVPKSVSGKILRRFLRDQAKADGDDDADKPKTVAVKAKL